MKPDRRTKWPRELVERARVLHERGYGYRMAAQLLFEETGQKPPQDTVRDWCGYRTRKGG